MPNENELVAAIEKYYKTLIACNQCTTILLSSPCSPEPARLMQEMYQAESEMFALIDIEYHGGKIHD